MQKLRILAGRLLRFMAGKIDTQSHNMMESRYAYQSRHRTFAILPNEKVVDIGCGDDPFPFASTLVDFHIEPSQHRYTDISMHSDRIVRADVECLPFADKEFDFVYCCHVLEHTQDPLKACAEIMRVGRRGYIETPTLMKDCLFSWAKGMHRWHVVAIGNRLCFYEYSDRLLEGIRSKAFRNQIFSSSRTDLQDAYIVNQDVFNVMFDWEEKFSVSVFHKNGSMNHI